MNERRILQKKSLGELFDKLIASGQRIIAPVREGERVAFEKVSSPEELADDYIQAVTSAKAAVFPRHEQLLRYRFAGKDIEVDENTPQAARTVLFGVHPCDAASLATLKAVFTWDSSDVCSETKLAATTVIGLSCTRGDDYCFCTSVGGSPGATRGSDILLTPLDGSQYLAEILTDKGRSVIQLAPQLFTAADGADKEKLLAKIPVRFAAEQVTQKLPALFYQSEAWTEASLRCLGCGACAFVCPTCSCFDIQDEHNRHGGVRLRCWDSCGFSLFTLHASGHNPRSKQSERWRQRVMHKFSYQPERLGVLGCVGCGRCSRSCPVDMNLAEHVQALAETKV
jgi:sulfhydrogenase subunit beta (sulfur reductase)